MIFDLRFLRKMVAIGILFAAFVFCLPVLKGQTLTPLERKLQKVVIEKVNFKDATLDAVLDYMSQIPVKTHQMDKPVNIVKLYSSSNPKLGETPITLSLTNIPWPELLRYICIAANINCRYEAYAVVLSAQKPAASPSPKP